LNLFRSSGDKEWSQALEENAMPRTTTTLKLATTSGVALIRDVLALLATAAIMAAATLAHAPYAENLMGF